MRISSAAIAIAVVVLGVAARAEDPKSQFITASDGIKIHYLEFGSGTPVILIHVAALDAVQKYPWKPGDREIDLQKVTVPVLAIVGGFDNPNARTHRLKREVKNAQITVLPKETHGSVHLNPAYTVTLVKFIDTHDR